MIIFEGLKVEYVTELPFDIDGLRHFKLKSDPAKMMCSSKDGRPWRALKNCGNRTPPYMCVGC